MMGFYPVTPGLPIYNIGSPMFEKSVIKMPGGKDFTIVAQNFSPDAKYIQSAKLNGREWDKPWFSHEDIADGGLLELVMGPRANKEWAASPGKVPPSLTYP
jgi:putative alpha-1,2-mannosidase